MGLSLEGIDAVKFLVAEGAEVVCCDRRTAAQLGENYQMLKAYPVKFHLGRTYLSGLENFAQVVRSPGVSPRLPELVAYQKKQRPLTSVTKLFFTHCLAPIIGVTGTKGKGTTSTLIANILETAGQRVFLGGNVGRPLLSEVRKIKKTDRVILELSSFQLEDMSVSPQIAVVLRITQDHLANHDKLASNYHETRETYVSAKQAIVAFQKPTDWAVLNKDCQVNRKYSQLTKARKLWFSRDTQKADAFVSGHEVFMRRSGQAIRVCAAQDIKLRGDHNLENIAAAALTANICGASLEVIQKVAHEFPGLVHRLEQVGVVGGVEYYNDSFSTVPETTIAAIASFSQPIILIAGGSEKGSDFRQMGEKIAQSTVKVLLAIGDMTDRIVAATQAAGFKGKIITGLKTMPEIVATASANAKSADIVLLSPAAASFDMFKNYKERGTQFKNEVAKL